jgi:hypothetical protein
MRDIQWMVRSRVLLVHYAPLLPLDGKLQCFVSYQKGIWYPAVLSAALKSPFLLLENVEM